MMTICKQVQTNASSSGASSSSSEAAADVIYTWKQAVHDVYQ